MQLRKLNWDSSFFAKEIYSCEIESIQEFEILESQIKFENVEFIYLFIKNDNSILHERLLKKGLTLVDKKITYKKELSNYSSDNDLVKSYSGPITKELKKLALLSGYYSRFKKDPNLNYKFSQLYKIWIEKSVKRICADEVFVVANEFDKIIGFVSCQIKNQVGQIGLIATDNSYQGKGYGKSLVDVVHNYYLQNNILIAKVNTQITNLNACRFYEKCGYEANEIVSIYHWSTPKK